MEEEDRREKVALGVSMVICLVLVAVALGGLSGPPNLSAIKRVRALAVEEFAVEADPTSSEVRSNDTVIDPEAELPKAQFPQTEQCRLSGVPLGYGSFGDDVFCLQFTLAKILMFDDIQNGLYDDNTFGAVLNYQLMQGLHEDGIIGRKTGQRLGIWPLDPFTVERTPVPPPGAVDDWGFLLSSVATAGGDAPPLPDKSGSGYRLVFDRAAQRVWAVDENETIIRSWLVSGSQEDNEVPGIHQVYSRSRTSISQDGESSFSYMVRWLKTQDDAIGFHSLPRRTWDDSLYQTEDELGIRLSSGCQRQANLDAEFTWKFATIGTTVIVL